MITGLVARADDRGLGIMSWEFARHMNPAKILVVREPGAESRGFTPHLERYPDALVANFRGGLDETTVRTFLDGLDVVYTAETPYDFRLYEWAHEMGVRTVCHVMPELFDRNSPRPDRIWAPTTWRLDQLGEARVVPVPVAVDRFASHSPGDPPVFLHRAGHIAAADRNGTQLVLLAASRIQSRVRLVVTTQDGGLVRKRPLPRNVDLVVLTKTTDDYWDAYSGADVLLMPRRYGGLSLPVNEAAASGLALVLSRCAPNTTTWPARFVSGSPVMMLKTAGGQIPCYKTNPLELAAAIDELAERPDEVKRLSAASLAWAAENSWDRLRPLYERELKEALT